MNDEAILQFVDTNILVHAHDVSAGEKHTQAKAIIQDLWQTGGGCLSIQVLQDFYVTITQKVPRPLLWEDAKWLVADLSTWRIYAPQAKDMRGAIDLQQRHRISFWDAMILQSAIQLGREVVLSEDLNPGQAYDGIRVTNPFVPPSQG